mmetsp:Transcript_22931/g.51016  ORF Transcript_22931/g.51016 Transcript_22931/m.51016 type:complete len:232 (+) Transcript_22931:166-861(+)
MHCFKTTSQTILLATNNGTGYDCLLGLLGILLGGILFGRRQNESSDSEVNKQVQVGAIHKTPGDQVVAVIGAVIRVLELKVPRRHTDKCSDEHLGDLADGDEVGWETLGDHSESLQTEVRVHKCMDGVVHRNKIQSRSSHGGVSVPAVQKHSDVVVPVKEDEGALSHNNEEGINQLRQLGEDEEHHPKTNSPISVSLFCWQAHCVLVWHGQDHTNKMGYCSDHTNKTKRCQ